MDDLNHGTRNKRGDWAPAKPLEVAPIWAMPPSPGKILKWLPGYFLPWNLLFALTAVAYWHWIVPDPADMQSLRWGWALRLLVANMAMLLVAYGAFELRLYVFRHQGTRFKYNGKFPSEQPSKVFLFGSQNIDNALRTFLVSAPLWTAIEVFILWCHANGLVPWLSLAENPWSLAVVALLVPVIHEAHFYCVHRLIHVPVLYRWIHSVHHNSVNPSPLSSLSMHPVEAFAYFAVGLWHLILPSNPLLAIYQLHYAGVGAFVGHLGFDKIEVTDKAGFDSHAYTHYLHHKYFEVNYGDGLVPFDKLFGTWHDGSTDSDERMKERFRIKKERMRRKAASGSV